MAITPTLLDLQACSREPIHIPGAIQPHGILICIRSADATVLQVSANSAGTLGCEPETCLNEPLANCLGAEQAAAVETVLKSGETDFPITLRFRDVDYDTLVHRSGELAILELAPRTDDSNAWNQIHHRLTRTIADLQRSPDLPSLCDAAVQAIADLTGFDRVMIYRFDPEWNGEVIAEIKAEGMDPYLGLHYPASDIPEQARKLYLRNWLRLIVDASYEPAPLLPVMNPDTGKPLDLSNSFLRSVSPVHLEYLRNMGVSASMSISLIREGQLWGLIACHHRVPRDLSFARRAACQLVGQIMSAEITNKENAAHQAARLEVRAVQLRFFEHLA
ncbi:MAG: GAF domain-containing protein, partial [Verrucomicrobiaceae bacterium]